MPGRKTGCGWGCSLHGLAGAVTRHLPPAEEEGSEFCQTNPLYQHVLRELQAARR